MMKSEFFRNKRLKGSLTVFAALVFICLLGFFTIIIRFSIYESILARVDNACLLSSESAFAGYSSDVFKKFGILVLSERVSADKRFKDILHKNLSGSGVSIRSVTTSEEVFITDNGGDFFILQAVDYMKTEGQADIIARAYKELTNRPQLGSREELHVEEGYKFLDGIDLEKGDLSEKELKQLEEFEGKEKPNWGYIEEVPNEKELKEQTEDGASRRSYFSLKKLFKKNICDLVLPESDISDRELKIKSWRQNELNKDRHADFGSSKRWKETGKLDELLFKEYLIRKYDSYLESKKGKDQTGLSYETEYILFGKKNDKANLAAAMRRIALIREGVNMAYLMTSTEKKSQARNLSLVILGFTLNPLIVKAGIYGILSLWAYGETICDLKALYKGDKIPVAKNNETWNLSLSELLTLRLRPKKYQGKTGADYKMFLRGMLLMKPKRQLAMRAMDIIEWREIGIGKKMFRMRDCVFSQVNSVVFSMPFYRKRYKKDMEYSYMN